MRLAPAAVLTALLLAGPTLAAAPPKAGIKSYAELHTPLPCTSN